MTYTVPTGNVAVVRDISVVPLASGLTNAELAINGVTRVWEVTAGTSNNSLHEECRAVLNAGEELLFQCTGAGCEVCISGYLLSD